MAHLLGAESLHLEYPTRVIFDSVTVGINEGDRVGVVGRNGDGKSTLLSLLAGRIQPDAGRVTQRRDVSGRRPVLLFLCGLGKYRLTLVGGVLSWPAAPRVRH